MFKSRYLSFVFNCDIYVASIYKIEHFKVHVGY